MPKWSKEQEKAIYTLNKNILVSASAGSGKTTVLIARLLHLVKDKKVPIDEILAMTFTEAAANEMKKRLSVSLLEAIEASNNEDETIYLQTQLANMSKSYISTIHGFCLRIIESYYYMIGIDKTRTTNILDDSIKVELLNESINESLTYYAQDTHMIALLTLFSSKGNDTQLKETIIKLFHLANSKSDPISFLQQCKGHLVSNIQDYDEVIKQYFFDYLDVQCNLLLEKLETRKIIDDGEQLDNIEDKITSIHTCKQHIQQQEYMLFKELWFTQSKVIIKKIKDVEESDVLKKEIEDIESTLHEILFDEDQFVTYTNENYPLLCLLCDIVIHVINQYNLKKEEVRGIDFDDMEQFALRILQANNHYIAKKYQSHFYEIMVDEFQDSNDVQAELVHLICKKNNVFRVGDIKQSIYGFRHATPDIMKALMDNKQEDDEIIYLSSNYRSKQSIVDFNNYLFTKVMNVDGFSKAFHSYDATQTGLTSQAEDNCPIELHLINDASINEGNFDKLSKDELKSSYIVNQMLRLKEEKGYDFKDFVVLIRQNDRANDLKQAFDDYQIPYFINMKDGFYHSSAITYVTNFLKALLHPHDNLCMCALLLSPFFKFSNNDLAKAKLEKQQDSFYTYFKNENKINSFIQLRESIKQMQITDVLEAIYKFNDYYFYQTSGQEKSNLDKLMEITYMQQSKEAMTLTSFIELLNKNKETKVGEAIPIGLQDNVVRVMSIHQSKGLQFPVVFLYSRESIKILDTIGLINFDSELHAGLHYLQQKDRLLYPTIERIAINNKLSKNALEEEMRILYVATTRAQNEMYIIDCAKNINDQALSATQLYNNSGYTKWITQAFHSPMPDLFQIHMIDTMWKNQIQEKEVFISDILQTYTQSVQQIHALAPSENEIFSFTPRAFVLDEDKFMQRGSDIHKMVELLPLMVDDISIISKCAIDNNISLSTKDIHSLFMLYKDPIFSASLQHEVYHELSFMTKKEDQMIHGYMDYVSISPDEVILIDFKSDRNVSETDLIERYEGQLKTYDEALCVMYPTHTIHTYIYSFTLEKVIKIYC